MEDRIPRKVALALRAMTQVETPDPTPVAIPVGYGEPLSLEDRLRMFVRQELSQAARSDGLEDFDQANDLEFEEDDELLSPYQVLDMREEFLPAEPAAEESDSESGADSAQEGGPQVAGSDPPIDDSEVVSASNPPPG